MPRRERPADARRTPPQLVEKPKDETTPGPGPRQPARVRSGARHRWVKQRMLNARIRRVTHLYVLAPAPAALFPSFTHLRLLPPRPRAARQPLPLPPRSLRPRLRARGVARGGAGASAHALLGCGCARPNRGPRYGGYAQVLSSLHCAGGRRWRCVRVPGSRRRGIHRSSSSSLARIRTPMVKTRQCRRMGPSAAVAVLASTQMRKKCWRRVVTQK
jgi:hypothetical protein